MKREWTKVSLRDFNLLNAISGYCWVWTESACPRGLVALFGSFVE